MTAVVSHSARPRFQLADADTWAEPWAMYSALRDHDPVHHVVPANNPHNDYYVLSRHADIWAAARDHETFSSAQGLPSATLIRRTHWVRPTHPGRAT